MERAGSTATAAPQGVTVSTIDPPHRIPARRPSPNVAPPGQREAVTRAMAVFREYGGFIRAAIHFWAAGKFDDDDVSQEFFLKLVASPVPPHVANMKRYLWCSVHYALLDLARRRMVERRHRRHFAEGAGAKTNDGPVQELILREEVSRTLAALARFLPYCEAWALLLRYRHACSVPEIAALMGVDVRTASHYLCTGLRKLREELGWDRRTIAESTGRG